MYSRFANQTLVKNRDGDIHCMSVPVDIIVFKMHLTGQLVSQPCLNHPSHRHAVLLSAAALFARLDDDK